MVTIDDWILSKCPPGRTLEQLERVSHTKSGLKQLGRSVSYQELEAAAGRLLSEGRLHVIHKRFYTPHKAPPVKPGRKPRQTDAQKRTVNLFPDKAPGW